MSKQYRTYQPNQCSLMPPSLDGWLPQDHLARFVNEIVDELDLSAHASYEQSLATTLPSLHDDEGVVVCITRRVFVQEDQASHHEDIAFRYLAAGTWTSYHQYLSEAPS